MATAWRWCRWWVMLSASVKDSCWSASGSSRCRQAPRPGPSLVASDAAAHGRHGVGAPVQADARAARLGGETALEQMRQGLGGDALAVVGEADVRQVRLVRVGRVGGDAQQAGLPVQAVGGDGLGGVDEQVGDHLLQGDAGDRHPAEAGHALVDLDAHPGEQFLGQQFRGLGDQPVQYQGFDGPLGLGKTALVGEDELHMVHLGADGLQFVGGPLDQCGQFTAGQLGEAGQVGAALGRGGPGRPVRRRPWPSPPAAPA